MKRNLTPEQQSARDERRAAFRKLAGEIGRMTTDERNALSAKLPVIATVEGRTLSGFNQCLVVSQCPTATLVGGFQQWLRAGRVVRKGEHSLAIWIPCATKADTNKQDGEVSSKELDGPRFIMGSVFDVSQTAEIEQSGQVAS